MVAAEINADSPDFGHLEPMISAAERELQAVGVSETPAVVVADAGYWHLDQMDAIVSRGTEVLIPPDAGKRKGTRPGWDGGRYAFMRGVLETDRGRALYGKRQGMIEPVFAHTKFNRRIDRFLRRGRAACRSEWRLVTATHNLLKLYGTAQPPRQPDGPGRRSGGSGHAPSGPIRINPPSAAARWPRLFTQQPPSTAVVRGGCRAASIPEMAKTMANGARRALTCAVCWTTCTSSSLVAMHSLGSTWRRGRRFESGVRPRRRVDGSQLNRPVNDER